MRAVRGGIKLMINECCRVGIPDSEFHADGGFVWVVFHYTRVVVGQVPTKYRPSSNVGKSPCRKEIIGKRFNGSSIVS